MFSQAQKVNDGWQLTNAWGHRFILPCAASFEDGQVVLATLGTRLRVDVRRVKKTNLLADMLQSLACPLYVLDTRRAGVGGSGSWSPETFASIISDLIGDQRTYSFLHLP